MSIEPNILARLQAVAESEWERPIETDEERAQAERILNACLPKRVPALDPARPTDPHWRVRFHDRPTSIPVEPALAEGTVPKGKL